MHIVVMGCGRVGSTLAAMLDAKGHSVAVIDQDAEAFRRLGPDFGGRTVTGVGFDRGVLADAGIDRADALAAVSSGDNSNIITARVAREQFDVESVVARIYDPGRAEVYQRLGIATVATVKWTAQQMYRRLVPGGVQSLWRDANDQVRLAQADVHPSWIGSPIGRLESATRARVAFVTRYDEALIPHADLVLQDGDLIHLIMKVEDEDHVAAVCDAPPGAED